MAAMILLAAGALVAPVIAFAPVCPAYDPLSCHNTTAIKDTCCTEVDGQVLQTQFWDTNPATGPASSWTIHGLWPDFCDGTYTGYCDPKREYNNISCILESYGRYDLLTYMNDTGSTEGGNNEQFWEHEWNKHGTCYSTLQPACFPAYRPQEEVVNFFQQTITQFTTLPTYQFLAAAGITPSATQNYTNDQIMAALRKPRGVNATIECNHGKLDEIYYTFNVKGSIADGQFVPANPVGEGNGCPATNIQYLPKDLATAPKVSSTSCPASAPTAS